MTEPVLPTPPEGYRFGTVTFIPTSGDVDPHRQERGHGLGRDGQHPAAELRQLALNKVLTGGPTSYNGPFAIVWDCGGPTPERPR